LETGSKKKEGENLNSWRGQKKSMLMKPFVALSACILNFNLMQPLPVPVPFILFCFLLTKARQNRKNL
jgi:hypothetical protein